MTLLPRRIHRKHPQLRVTMENGELRSSRQPRRTPLLPLLNRKYKHLPNRRKCRRVTMSFWRKGHRLLLLWDWERRKGDKSMRSLWRGRLLDVKLRMMCSLPARWITHTSLKRVVLINSGGRRKHQARPKLHRKRTKSSSRLMGHSLLHLEQVDLLEDQASVDVVVGVEVVVANVEVVVVSVVDVVLVGIEVDEEGVLRGVLAGLLVEGDIPLRRRRMIRRLSLRWAHRRRSRVCHLITSPLHQIGCPSLCMPPSLPALSICLTPAPLHISWHRTSSILALVGVFGSETKCK